MPAITAPDITKLERVPPVSETARQRPVREVVLAPHGLEGEGFPVRRAFAGADLADLDEHQDSNGGGGVITNGDTQWMTAGAGILHIERPPERLVASGGLFHGIQLWVNLPKAEKWAPPRYQDLRANEVSLLASPDAGALVRVIAGDVAGRHGPGQTYTPMTMLHATIAPGARLELPWRPEFNALAYVLAGAGTVGSERRPIETGQLAVFGSGDAISLEAASVQESRSPALEALLLGGRPIREPVAWYGPFVMNTRDELLQAFEDYQAGRLGQIPAISGAHHTPDHIFESDPEPIDS
jgi:redox-sensitive bicupin YhaK (pirin superfamily)